MVLSLSFKPLHISHTSYTNRFIVKGYFYIFIQSFLLILSKWAHFFITFEKEKILKKIPLIEDTSLYNRSTNHQTFKRFINETKNLFDKISLLLRSSRN